MKFNVDGCLCHLTRYYVGVGYREENKQPSARGDVTKEILLMMQDMSRPVAIELTQDVTTAKNCLVPAGFYCNSWTIPEKISVYDGELWADVPVEKRSPGMEVSILTARSSPGPPKGAHPFFVSNIIIPPTRMSFGQVSVSPEFISGAKWRHQIMHCVGADGAFGAGFARALLSELGNEVKIQFKSVGRVQVGDVVVLPPGYRNGKSCGTLFNLVTKPKSGEPPRDGAGLAKCLATLAMYLEGDIDVRTGLRSNRRTGIINCPALGTGLDSLCPREVLSMLVEFSKKAEQEVMVCGGHMAYHMGSRGHAQCNLPSPGTVHVAHVTKTKENPTGETGQDGSARTGASAGGSTESGRQEQRRSQEQQNQQQQQQRQQQQQQQQRQQQQQGQWNQQQQHSRPNPSQDQDDDEEEFWRWFDEQREEHYRQQEEHERAEAHARGEDTNQFFRGGERSQRRDDASAGGMGGNGGNPGGNSSPGGSQSNGSAGSANQNNAGGTHQGRPNNGNNDGGSGAGSHRHGSGFAGARSYTTYDPNKVPQCRGDLITLLRHRVALAVYGCLYDHARRLRGRQACMTLLTEANIEAWIVENGWSIDGILDEAMADVLIPTAEDLNIIAMRPEEVRRARRVNEFILHRRVEVGQWKLWSNNRPTMHGWVYAGASAVALSAALTLWSQECYSEAMLLAAAPTAALMLVHPNTQSVSRVAAPLLGCVWAGTIFYRLGVKTHPIGGLARRAFISPVYASRRGAAMFVPGLVEKTPGYFAHTANYVKDLLFTKDITAANVAKLCFERIPVWKWATDWLGSLVGAAITMPLYGVYISNADSTDELHD